MDNGDRTMRGTPVRCEGFAPEHVGEVIALLTAEFPPEPGQDTENLTGLARQNIGELPNLGRRYPLLVADDEETDRVVGVATTKPHGYESEYVTGPRWFGETAILNQVTVLPAYRGHGVATRLIKQTVQECFDAGHTQVFAHLTDGHADWYTANGWTVPASAHWWAWVERHCEDDYLVATDFLGKSPTEAAEFGSVMYVFPGNPKYPRLARITTRDAPVGGHGRVNEKNKADDVTRIILTDLNRKPRKWSRLPLGPARSLRIEKNRLGI